MLVRCRSMGNGRDRGAAADGAANSPVRPTAASRTTTVRGTRRDRPVELGAGRAVWRDPPPGFGFGLVVGSAMVRLLPSRCHRAGRDAADRSTARPPVAYPRIIVNATYIYP